MKLIAHRGAREFFPENTLEALEKAVELGFDGVECDVRRCQSGELILMHDSDLDRTTDGKGPVAASTYDYLISLKIDRRFAIPTLKQVVDRILPRTWLNIEIKDADPTILPDIVKLIPAGQRGRVLVSSKKPVAIASADCPLALAAIHPLGFIALRRAQRLGLSRLVTRNWLINRPGWRAAIRQNRSVFLYTANRRRQLARLQADGVAGVISDTAGVLE
jgi:glycerophosphoryl diester phosphodiesterase